MTSAPATAAADMCPQCHRDNADPWGLCANCSNAHPQPEPRKADPTMTTQTVLADALAPLAADLARVLADKADLEQEEKDIKAQIRKLVPGPDTYQAGAATLVISANRRFDPNLAERILPWELIDLCRVSKVDATAAKNILPPALFQQCMSEVGDYRVGFAR